MDLANGGTDLQGALPHRERKMALLSSSLPRVNQGPVSWGGSQKSAELRSPPHPCLPAATLALWIPVGSERPMLVALTNINLQSPGCNFTLCCVHKL